MVHPIEFAGIYFEEKLLHLREYMNMNGFDVMVVSEPDEVNWLFNVRGESETVSQVYIST